MLRLKVPVTSVRDLGVKLEVLSRNITYRTKNFTALSCRKLSYVQCTVSKTICISRRLFWPVQKQYELTLNAKGLVYLFVNQWLDLPKYVSVCQSTRYRDFVYNYANIAR